ncbi:hypothetical protein RB597_007151 [Gaeumannomyces tritici]
MAPSTPSLLAAALLAFSPQVLAKDWEGAPYKWLFQYPLPIPPVKKPKYDTPFKHPVTGRDINYFEVEEKLFSKNVYPDRGNATFRGYDGVTPGPTFLVEKETENIVRFTNHIDMATSVHLHGSSTRSPWDGWAEDLTSPGETKDYYYPDSQSGRMQWYHDHALDHTAENAYFGLAGAYIIHDPAEDSLNLPSGYGQFDIPLILTSKQYNDDGTLYSPANERTSLYGDVINVNGQPWPFFNVQPRKYRFRFLNAGISRSFFLYWADVADKAGTKIKFDVIASDTGLLSGPQKSDSLYLSIAERYEVVFDFSGFKGKTLMLRNTRGFAADTDYLHTDKVMTFVVSKDSVPDPSEVKSSFRTIPYPDPKATVDRHFRFERQGGEWTINGATWADANNRVMSKPPRGTVEVWELENSSSGWTHPIHVHLVDFQVVKRTGGKRDVQSYEAQGLKDVVWLGPGETVTIRARYSPWDGLYMFHCHNLIHEDHAMMAAFNVTALEGLGYNETSFADPMEKRWRAVPETPELFSLDAITKRVAFMAGEQPYNNEDEAEKRVKAYWATKTAAAASPATPTPTSKSGSGKGDDNSGKSGPGKSGSGKREAPRVAPARRSPRRAGRA